MRPAHHHRLLRALLAELRRLRGRIEALRDEHNEDIERANQRAYDMEVRNQKARSAVSRLEHEVRQREQDIENEHDDRARLVKDLERARSYGNEYDVERITRKLRDL